jgi:hypothetical protein
MTLRLNGLAGLLKSIVTFIKLKMTSLMFIPLEVIMNNNQSFDAAVGVITNGSKFH